ncbi:DUF6777 domain-containing protein [Streptomyces tropicalis]|uniref:DUF6777 domain-containing protein n=1 Tax=Streptomyces tropicalis TaxID=3034234 RepID=A0ABT6AB57_9ACTN|nr:DUF6777 domain-containing protein [Streptomyces tropicalis]MDF3301698.1 hypothetical protein [Streptomyces tropicalis]
MPRTKRENVVRTPTGTLATACALSVTILVAGCAGGERTTRLSGELFLEPVADRGPDPFTESTVTTAAASPAAPAPASRTPATAQPGPARTAGAHGLRSVVGDTPGLYGGTLHVAGCDVERQIRHLTAEHDRSRAFAEAMGIDAAALPAYLRGLTPVQLRADTRVTAHGFRSGHPTTRQSLLQTGTAVLVDNHGVPRLRCVCGNPLEPPVALPGAPTARGRAWPAYQSSDVVVVTPAPVALTTLALVDPAHGAWIERRLGRSAALDRFVARPPRPASPDPPPPGGAGVPTGSLPG